MDENVPVVETTEEPKQELVPVKQEEALAPMKALPPEERTMWNDPIIMKQSYTMAKVLSGTTMVPQAYKNQPGNCLIAIDFANRMNTSPLMIMQNLDVIQGNPAWRGQACVALVNNCGRFEPIKFDETYDQKTGDFSCTAYAKEKSSGEILRGTKVDKKLAVDCGWMDKPGSYWKKMPQQMARYRAATFFARTYSPEALMGLYTVEEQRDITGKYEDNNRVVVELKKEVVNEQNQ